MLQDIYNHLKKEKLNPYFIGQHKGECKEPYVVIKEGSAIPSIPSNYVGLKVVDMILFVPSSSFIELGKYEQKIKKSLKKISYLRKTGTETPSIPDNDKNAYTKSIEYTLQRKVGR